MSRFNRKRYCLEIAEHAFALSVRAGPQLPWTQVAVVVCPQLLRNADFGARLRDCLAAHLDAGARLAVVVDDALACFFMVTPPPGIASPRALRTIAGLRFTALFGHPKNDWLLQAEWRASVPFLACALPRLLVDGVLAALAACRGVADGMNPAGVWAWNRAASGMREARAWFASIGAGHLLLAACERGGVVAVSPSRTSGPVSLEDLGAALRRESLRWDRELPQTLYVAGAAAAPWHDRMVGACALRCVAPETGSRAGAAADWRGAAMPVTEPA